MAHVGTYSNNCETKILQGMLESDDGEVISIRGSAKVPRNPEEGEATTSDTTMDVVIVDGEAGNQVQLHDVRILVDRLSATIENPSLYFRTTDILRGNRADVEIQQFMNPDWLGAKEVFVGVMRIQVLASQSTQELQRRESTCYDDNTVSIIEQSDDFLA